jgi:Asp-tRNA(Asn)/Glu-tRNA(Gln) amidotransferase A subunit family amidase
MMAEDRPLPMSSADALSALLACLRANTARSGLHLSDDALARIADSPALRAVDHFTRLIARFPSDTVPDLLKDWHDPQPYAVPVAAALGGVAPVPTTDPLDPFAPLHVVAAALAARAISPVALTELLLDRIARHDPALNAYQLVLGEQARVAAAEAEREIAAGRYRGPFHGVPVAVKDLLAMAGLPTTAGSTILADWVPDRDAEAVRRLQEAGAVIIGKTRLSEFAYSPASNNAHYGPTHNPWHLERDSGGSSSGSAAAVAAGLAYLALGSDTGCSIRAPSALCGLVGLKPTHGRISLAGAITLSWSLDHLGPMVRSVRDAALALDLLAGYDPRDARTRRGRVPDFAAALDRPGGVAGLRIGAVREDGAPLGPAEPEAIAAWEDGLRALRDAGATVVDLALPELEDMRVIAAAIIGLEGVAYHEPSLRARPQDFGPSLRESLPVAYAYGPTAYVQAQQVRAVLRARFERLWERVDLLSTPAVAYGAPALGEARDNTRYALPFNGLGWPAIVVPTGLTGEGLPLSTQLIGRPWDEVTVLRAALEVERRGPWGGRHAPGF